jgi:hypothetical protein
MVTSGIGPDQTFVASEGKNNLLKESPRLTAHRHLAQWIAIAPPTKIMSVAPSARMKRLAAALNRAYSGISHFDLRDRLAWSERAAMFLHPARSFYSIIHWHWQARRNAVRALVEGE